MRTQSIFLAVTCFLGDAHFTHIHNYNPRLPHQGITNRRFIRNVAPETQNLHDTESNPIPYVSNDNSSKEGNAADVFKFNGYSNDNHTSNGSSIESNVELSAIQSVEEGHKLSTKIANNTEFFSEQPSNSTADINTTAVHLTDLSKPNDDYITFVHPSISTPVPITKDIMVQTTLPNEPVLIDNSSMIVKNHSETNETSPTSKIYSNTTDAPLQVQSIYNSNVISKNFSLESKNPPSPNITASSIQMASTTESVIIDESNATIRNYYSTSETSTTAAATDSNLNVSTLQTEPVHSSNETNTTINFESENASVSTTAANAEATNIEMTTLSDPVFTDNSNSTIENYGSTTAKSCNDENLNSTNLEVESADNFKFTSQNTSLENHSSSESTPAANIEATFVPMITTSESVLIDESNITIQNYYLTIKKLTFSTTDPNPNTTTLPTEPTVDSNVTNTDVNFESENPSVSTAPNIEITTSSNSALVDNSIVTITDYSTTTEKSSIDENLDSPYFEANPLGNFNIINKNINLRSKRPFVSRPKNRKPSVSTLIPNTEVTTVEANFQTESILTGNFNVTILKNSPANEEISVSTPKPISTAITNQITVSTNPNVITNVTNSNNPWAKNSSSIPSDANSKDPNEDGSNDESNLTISGSDETNSTPVTQNHSEGSTVITEISKIVKEQNCTSILKSALIDSFTKIIIEIDAELIDEFISALNQSFVEIYGESHPINSLKFLALVDELGSIDILVNNLLSRISDKESLVLKTIGEEKLPSGSNDSILKIFREIENSVKELNSEEFRNDALRSAVVFEITVLIKTTTNNLLFSMRKKVISQLRETPEIKNSLSRMKTIVDNFLQCTQFYERKFSPKSVFFTEMILDLIEEATNVKDDFMKNFQCSWIDFLLKVEEEEKLFDNLSTSVFNVLEDLQKQIQKSKLNRLENTKISKNFDQLEEFINSQMFNFSIPVKKLINESMELSRNLLDDLKTLFENGSDSATIYGTTIGIFTSTMSHLQQKVPSLLDINFFNGTISLNNSELNEIYENAADNEFIFFYECENANNNQHEKGNANQYLRTVSGENFTHTNNAVFSTSSGRFTHPFEYSLTFVLLIYYIVIW